MEPYYRYDRKSKDRRREERKKEEKRREDMKMKMMCLVYSVPMVNDATVLSISLI